MNQNNQIKNVEVIQLKHMNLEPSCLKLNKSCHILLKILYNNSSSLSNTYQYKERKFLFIIEQTDEESPAMCQGDEYLFKNVLETGLYTLQCINHTKIRCTIDIIISQEDKSEVGIEQIIRASQGVLCDMTEIKQEKQEELKDQNDQVIQINSNADYSSYQKILNDEDMQYDSLPNKYLKYFKEQFKLWRDFFEEPKPINKQKSLQNSSPQMFSIDSLDLSSKSSEKDQSVISHLRSQQQISDIQQQQLNRTRIMKKTNSQYGFKVIKQSEKPVIYTGSTRKLLTNTSSPHQRTQQSQMDTFLDWACNWAQQSKLPQINIKKLKDSHLVSQWLTFMHNKYKIAQFMYT